MRKLSDPAPHQFHGAGERPCRRHLDIAGPDRQLPYFLLLLQHADQRVCQRRYRRAHNVLAPSAVSGMSQDPQTVRTHTHPDHRGCAVWRV